MTKEDILKELAECVVEMEEERVVELAEEAIKAGLTPDEAILEGLSKGMEKVSELFEEGEYFIPEVVVCADAMYAGIDYLKQFKEKESKYNGTVVIGVVEGDTHDIGKNIVGIMLEAAGFKIYDLGRNVELKKFVDKAEEVKADLIILSSLMTTTMVYMKDIIEDLHSRNIDKRPFVMVGGAPVSQSFAREIGADGYSTNAPEAVRLAKELMMKRGA